jgi:hypothetical protein
VTARLYQHRPSPFADAGSDRCDHQFQLDQHRPSPSIGQTNFAVAGLGCVQPEYSETYTFTDRHRQRRAPLGQRSVADLRVGQPAGKPPGATPSPSRPSSATTSKWISSITGGAVAQLYWSSPSTPKAIIPQTQLYPYTNPPPPSSCPARPTARPSRPPPAFRSAPTPTPFTILELRQLLYQRRLLGAVSNAPYALTATGLPAGSYTLTATATDGSGLTSTSAPVAITVTAGSGLPYGLTTNGTLAPFLNQNMPGSLHGSIPPLLSRRARLPTPQPHSRGRIDSLCAQHPLWSDNAVKSRYWGAQQRRASFTAGPADWLCPTGQWTFPSGTVFVKNFDLVVNQTNPNVPCAAWKRGCWCATPTARSMA